MKKILLIFFFIISISAKGQICDSLVPVFNVDFTGTNSGTTWFSPTIQRNGLCCESISPDVCINFVFSTDTNTCAVLFTPIYGQLPIGAMYYRVCCGNTYEVGDTTFISNPGIHAITFCRPGNTVWYYSLASFTQCDSIGFDPVCPLILNTSHEISRKDFIFSPNPFHTTATLEMKNAELRMQNVELKIYDMMGRLMKEQIINQQSSIINRENLADGIYFYQITNDGRQMACGKFVAN